MMARINGCVEKRNKESKENEGSKVTSVLAGTFSDSNKARSLKATTHIFPFTNPGRLLGPLRLNLLYASWFSLHVTLYLIPQSEPLHHA